VLSFPLKRSELLSFIYFTLLILSGYLGIEYVQAGTRVDVATSDYVADRVSAPYDTVVGNTLSVSNCIILGEASEGHRLYGSNDYLILHGQYGELNFKDDGTHLSYGETEYAFLPGGIQMTNGDYMATEEYAVAYADSVRYQAVITSDDYEPVYGYGCTVTIQIKNMSGVNATNNFCFPAWISATATGGVPYNPAQMFITNVTDCVIIQGAIATAVPIWIATGTDGDAKFDIDSTAATTNYVHCVINDKVWSSSAIAFGIP